MSEEIEIAGIQVPKADWDATPPSIRALVLALSERLRQQDERIRQLEERLNQTSKNSSKPPSSDGFGQTSRGQQTGKKRRPLRSSKSSPRQVRKLKPSAACDQVKTVFPSVCEVCGTPLTGQDSRPHRHQEIELPPIEPRVIEYQLHQLCCEACGHLTRAELPTGVSPSGYGACLSAIVALLSGPYRQSYRQVGALMSDLFGVPLSRGTVGRLQMRLISLVYFSSLAVLKITSMLNDCLLSFFSSSIRPSWRLNRSISKNGFSSSLLLSTRSE
jgi:transposase